MVNALNTGMGNAARRVAAWPLPSACAAAPWLALLAPPSPAAGLRGQRSLRLSRFHHQLALALALPLAGQLCADPAVDGIQDLPGSRRVTA